MYYSSIMYVFVQLLIVISYLVLCAILTNHRTCCNCCGSLFAVSCYTSANFPTTMGWCSWSCSSHRRAMALWAINVQFGCRNCVDSEPFFCDSQKACPGTTKVPTRLSNPTTAPPFTAPPQRRHPSRRAFLVLCPLQRNTACSPGAVPWCGRKYLT
jgi:hypothetical protein